MSDTASSLGRLPCGAVVDDLLEQVADRVPATDPAHQAGCVHCQAMLAELTRLWEPMREASEERVSAPAGLLTAVMARVRLLAENPWHGVLTGERGVTRIASWVVAAIARLAAYRVPGVSYVHGHVTEDTASASGRAWRPGARAAGARSGVGLSGDRAVINLEVTARYGTALPELADRVRRAVHGDVKGLAGMDIVAVNVLVVDLDDDSDPGPAPQTLPERHDDPIIVSPTKPGHEPTPTV